LLSTAGCADWPHFDYETSPERVVAEGSDDVSILDVGMIEGSVAMEGVISDGHFLPEGSSVFGASLEGWYTEDMDWFQFQLRDPQTVAISLEWSGEGDLDFLLARADGSGNLNILEESNQEAAASPSLIPPIELEAFPAYAVAIAPRDAEQGPLAYRVLLLPEGAE
jgi:hypothetical protein